jgi:isopenicillin-N N-acyltransferase-like protein
MMEIVPQGLGGGAAGFSESTLLAFARAHDAPTQAFAPDIHQEMEGIASGAGMPFEKILLLNCVAEIRRLMFTPSAVEALHAIRPHARPSSTLPVQPGCTCFAVQGQATLDGEIYIGQGYDIDPVWEPILFRIHDGPEEMEQLVMGHAGILAQFGLNGAGLALVASGLLVTDQRPGVPAPVLARKILQQKRLCDGLEVIVQARRTIGIDYILATPFGVVNLETIATEHDCHYLQTDILATANHVRSPALKPLQAGSYGMDSFVRLGRMEQLLRREHGSLVLESLQEIQRDHADYPFAICRHTQNGLSDAETRCAVILKPVERLMWIAGGNPCSWPYQEFKLQTAA